MKLAIQGLGRMGMQIARKLSESPEHSIIGYDLSRASVDQAITYGITPAYNKNEVLGAFGAEPVVIWIMLPAQVVDAEVDDWLRLLPAASTFIDGGNSDYRNTKHLASKLKDHGHTLVDVGTSGGVWGYQNGFSMMIGTDDQTAFTQIEPALKTLALPEGGYDYFGPAGSGHFVKMTHNAVEYGMMESLAEGYHMLKDGPYKNLDLAAAAEVWQHHSVVTSWLNELSRDALRENPELNGIDGFVQETGEARWTLETAHELKLPMPSIQAAFDVRVASQKGTVNFATKLLAAMRNKFGGHELNK